MLCKLSPLKQLLQQGSFLDLNREEVRHGLLGLTFHSYGASHSQPASIPMTSPGKFYSLIIIKIIIKKTNTNHAVFLKQTREGDWVDFLQSSKGGGSLKQRLLRRCRFRLSERVETGDKLEFSICLTDSRGTGCSFANVRSSQHHTVEWN